VNLFEIIAIHQQENAGEKTGMKELQEKIKGQQEVNAKYIKDIVSVQQEIKEQLAGNSYVLNEEIKKIASKSRVFETLEPSKQALVSALVSEFVVIFNKSMSNINSVFQQRFLSPVRIH